MRPMMDGEKAGTHICVPYTCIGVVRNSPTRWETRPEMCDIPSHEDPKENTAL